MSDTYQSQLTGEYHVLTITDIAKSDYPGLNWLRAYDADDTVRVYQGDLNVAGDLDLDTVDDDEPYYGIIVHGDLHVDGCIMNSDFNAGIYLHVKGTTYANSLVAGGGYIHLNVAKIKNIVLGNYNDGDLSIKKLECKVLFNIDHSISISDSSGVSISCDEMCYTKGQANVDLQDLACDWYHYNIFPEHISLEDAETCGLDEGDGSYYYIDHSLFIDKISDRQEAELIEYFHRHLAEAKQRTKDFPIEKGLTNYIKVTWDNGFAVKVRIYTNTGNEALEQALKKSVPKKLTELVILQNPSAIADAIVKLKTLKRLVIRRTYLKEFPTWVCKLDSLVELDLTDNAIKTIPACIGELTRLNKLVLSENSISEIDAAIGKLHALTELDLSNAAIVSLPPALRQLKQLRILKLTNNHLDDLPEWISELTALEVLHVDNNYFDDVPAGVRALPHLVELKV